MDQEPRKLQEASAKCLLLAAPAFWCFFPPGLCRAWPPVCHRELSMLILDSINMFISSDF